MSSTPPIPLRGIFRFWVPLFATWLMMSCEGPLLAALIARLPDPKANLAAFGVAFAVAILIEAPVIMMLSASTALVDDAHSFRKLRRFAYLLNGLITVVMVFLLATPAWMALAQGAIGLDRPVAELTQRALLLLLPWPAAIGYRRFYQGLLIRGNATRLIAIGTVIRLSTMGATGFGLFAFSAIDGAMVGAAALSAGVVAEAAASRFMSRPIVRRVCEGPAPREQDSGLTYGQIARFYYPLALTSLISLAAQPMVTFFMGRAPHPLESLAVFPVVHALTFVFRSVGLSFQEVAIALIGRNEADYPQVARFGSILGWTSSLGLAVVAFTPLAPVWFRQVSGLGAELTAYAIAPTQILAILPALSVLISLQRAVLVHGRATGPVTWATIAEIGSTALTFVAVAAAAAIPGVTAAAVAFVVGRLVANLGLWRPCSRIVRRLRVAG